MPDVPKSLRDPATREARLGMLHAPHVAPLSAFVEQLRAEMGTEFYIPYFDPLDGGTGAECLFLLEAPGPRAVGSGFISRNNPDDSARNMFELNAEAGIDRKRTALWNVVPWYVGTDSDITRSRIREVTPADIAAADSALARLLALLPLVRVIVLMGQKAARAHARIAALRPEARIMVTPHPSPLFVNNAPGNRARLLAALREVAEAMTLAPLA